MSKFEKEIKVLDIDVNVTKEKLNNIGAEFLGEKEQKIFTYDIPTLYYRFLEIMELLNSSNTLLIKTTIKKLEIVLNEFSDLVDDSKMKIIFKEMNISNFAELLKLNPKKIIEKCNKSKIFQEEISNKLINPNKWLRLRKSNNKIELTCKHIFEKSNSSIQKVKECEIVVSNLEETNLLLEELGIVRRNYQEKIRNSFKYKSADIEIDEWPNLDPYLEIECDNEEIIEEIIEKLDLKFNEIVSVNTEQLYKRKNIDILKISDLKF